jgi:hypothetical protein
MPCPLVEWVFCGWAVASAFAVLVVVVVVSRLLSSLLVASYSTRVGSMHTHLPTYTDTGTFAVTDTATDTRMHRTRTRTHAQPAPALLHSIKLCAAGADHKLRYLDIDMTGVGESISRSVQIESKAQVALDGVGLCVLRTSIWDKPPVGRSSH